MPGSAVLARLPRDAQLSAPGRALTREKIVAEVVRRAAGRGLPGWYVRTGCAREAKAGRWREVRPELRVRAGPESAA
ncbi:hypothetical protein [Streptomyces sp. NRRL F-5630]|uniref:hypothetical protein n=1 Tax=Streptomyces sp. NRRL F-5630 TaxID=1463864 RepID=UPI003D74D450